MLSKSKVEKIASQSILVEDLSDDELADFCVIANQSYRDGKPIVSDQDYDFVFLTALNSRQPNHPFLQELEIEHEGFSEEKVKLPERMLSTNKAYSWADIQKWLERIVKSAEEINLSVDDIELKGTAKLDGFAGYDDGVKLYTRGDGSKGSDISRVFERGLGVYKDAKRGLGAGEIVVKRSYFEVHLSQYFEYPRNFQASLIKEKELDQFAEKAIADKAALFVPFKELPNWLGGISTLTGNFDTIVGVLEGGVDFDVDGVVFEVVNAELKTHMGANRKFHRWQVAYKENKEKAQVEVLSVTAQVGRTGKITPVAELEPTQLSGATIYRATGHHYGLVKEQGLGAGSVVELTRSGLVIPKINRVIEPAKVSIPNKCPSCKSELVWESDFLMCMNHENCRDQIVGKMSYFYKVLANNDGFGLATIQKLYDHGLRQVSDIYLLTQEELMEIGFGEKTSQNLIDQLRRSRQESIEDWRFLAAFGVPRLGMGNCENLLKYCALESVFNLSVEDIANIEGFAELTAELIVRGLLSIKKEYEKLISGGFTLESTLLNFGDSQDNHPLHNKRIVFTGTMSQSRADLTKQAKSFGIKVSSSVSAKTDYLVTGENVGQSKLKATKGYDISILTENEYLQILKTK